MDLKERVLGITYELITRYGISSVTMDFIAKECGISKRTLYEQFTDKNNLVLSAIARRNDEQNQQFCDIAESSPNQLILMLRIYSIVCDFFASINPIFFLDMIRLYPEIYNEYKEIRDEHAKYFLCILENGKKEGVFRPDFNSEIMSSLYFDEMQMIKNKCDKPTEKYSLLEVYACFFENFTRGIVTPKGLEIFEQFKMDNKNKF